MVNSDYLGRLRYIYTLLKDNSCDVNELYTKLQKKGFRVLRRQIYRDIESVSNYFLTENEELLTTNINNKKKVWKVNKRSDTNQINIDDIYGRILLKTSVPPYINDEVKNSIQNELKQELNSKYKQNQLSLKVLECEDVIVKLDFGEKLFCEKTYTIFKDLMWCIVNQVKIRIKVLPECIVSIVKGDNVYVSILSPLCFIQHRGSIHLVGMTPQKRILIFDLIEISNYEYLKSTYKNRSELMRLFKNNLYNRFGICENIDDRVYDIEIELTRDLGDYLKKFNWHHSQRFKVIDKGYILQLKCGINKELLGWISTLRINSKIVKPEKLKLLFCQELIKMTEIYLSDKSL